MAGLFVVGHEPLNMLEVFAAALAGWGGHLAAGLGAQALVVGVGGDLADRTGDGGAAHTEPAGQDVVGDAVAEVDERGQESIDEDELVPGPGSHRP